MKRGVRKRLLLPRKSKVRAFWSLPDSEILVSVTPQLLTISGSGSWMNWQSAMPYTLVETKVAP